MFIHVSCKNSLILKVQYIYIHRHFSEGVYKISLNISCNIYLVCRTSQTDITMNATVKVFRGETFLFFSGFLMFSWLVSSFL